MASTRRQLLKAGIVTGAAAAIGGPQLLTGASRAAAATFDPTTIPRFVTPLFVLPAMPPQSIRHDWDQYSVAARPIRQQVLPAGYPKTPMLGIGSTTSSRSFHAPGYTFEATVDRQTRMTWWNQLVQRNGNFQPSLLPIDPTLHWFNAPGGVNGRDSTTTFASTPGPYTGPMPFVVHLHGAHDYQESDGYPEAWYLPVAKDIPAGYAKVGSFYDRFKQESFDKYGLVWAPGSSTYVFDNDQRATGLWYHDHSLGITRTSVRSGLTGLYMLRGGSSDLPPGVLPGPAPGPFDPPGQNHYEIPLIIQDPSFNTDGSQFLPDVNRFSPGPYIPETDIQPIWNVVFFGDTLAVNGNTWPYLDVEPRRYRFRVLNATSVRTLGLKVVSDPTGASPQEAALPIWVIGSDGGLLPRPQAIEGTDSLPIVTSERYDVVIDFTGLTPGTTLYLNNEGNVVSPDTTGTFMQFRVIPLRSHDTSVPPDQLGNLPGHVPITNPTNTRQVSFNSQFSAFQPDVTVHELCGNVGPGGTPIPLGWGDPLTDNPALNSTEIWEVWNFTPITHAFHIHLVEFQLLDRRPIGGGATTAPLPWETGDKDTVPATNGQITRLIAKFDHEGRFVWHCHFFDHEDNEMMRPWKVGNVF